MSKYPKRNLTDAMLQPGRQPAVTATGNALPMGEMQMILTLDQLAPNPDNPRTTRNPRYDEIKASIRARGLDSVPKVTRDPDSDSDAYIFSDGGNTRFAILSELWQETGDERFWRINVVFKPWPGRLQCVVGHLAENDVRGDLTFIEKALGVTRARELYEDTHGKLSVRRFAQMLTSDGMPLDVSSASRMINTVDYLWPSMPALLTAGMGRPQINALLAMRQGALELWQEYEEDLSLPPSFEDVFAACCRKFDAPELWQADAFRDELIGDCLKAFSHPELNYDRWLLALEPRKKTQESSSFAIQPEMSSASDGEESLHHESGDESPPPRPPVTEEQPDLYGGDSVYSGEPLSDRTDGKRVATGNTPDVSSAASGYQDPGPVVQDERDSALTVGDAPFSTGGPAGEDGMVNGDMLSGDTDIEHLQSQAFRLAWAIADSRGYGDHILPAREHVRASGYCAADVMPVPVTLLLTSLTGDAPQSTSVSLNSIQGALFVSLFTGGTEKEELPDLDDDNAQRLIQLLGVLRRLRALQRHIPDDEESFSDDE